MFAFRAAATALALCTAAADAHAQTRYETLTDTLWRTVNENFYDPHFRGADWAGARARYAERAAAVRSDAEFAALAEAMLAEIGSSHLHLSPPSTSAARAVGVGVRWRAFADEQIAVEVAPLTDAALQGVRPGDRLLSDSAALAGAIGTRAAMRIQSCDGTRRSLQVRRASAFWPPEHPGFRWSQIQTGDDTRIGYMRIGRFDDGAAELADRAMEELADTSGLIIDLRGNSGGNTSALRLASYFGPGPEPAVVLLARPYLDALGRPASAADIAAAPRVDGAYTDEAVFGAVSAHGGGAAFWTEAAPRPYRAPVVVLIGEDTGSAAEGFAWYMKLRTHAHFLGRTTSGALLSGDRFDIGEGWTVTIPVHGLWGPDGRDYGDQAVTPHEAVSWTRADLCAGRDPDLAAAMARLGAR